MQKDQKLNLEVWSKDEVDSQCSCLECDSASCFVKRRANEHCTCASRVPSGLYTHFNQSSKLLTGTKHSISRPQILPKVQRVPDLKKNTRRIICEFVNETNKNVITDSTTTIFKISNTSFSQRQGNSRKTSSFIKDSREESKKDKGSNVYCYRKKAYRATPKDAACQNMSAVVGHNMPHQDLQAPIPKTKISSAIVNLSAVDIYNKIEEAYKECSCEVCECIVGKSLQNEFCGYKPCEWDGCATLSECMLSYIGTEVIQKHDEECFCLLCDKKSCKVLDDSERNLHGYHDNCKLLKCGKGCDCKRCECIKCKARPIHRTLIVAPVGGELQPHDGCRCAPCECFECRHRYGVTTNGQHEISTGVNRHPHCHCEVCDNEACIPDNNQSCRCVRQSQVMSKPVERDPNDYDIRTAHVTYNNKGICEGNFETLAMFAALPSSYTKRIDQSKQCDCDHCECLNCEYFDCTNSQNAFQSSLKSYQLDRLHGKFRHYKPDVLEPFKLKDRRVLDTCDRIDCDNLFNSLVEDEKSTKKLNRKCSSTHICDCNICECVGSENSEIECFKNHGEDASVDITRLVKSRKQTRLKNNDPLIQSCIDTIESNKKIFKQHELSFHASKSSTSNDNFGESHHPTCRQVSYGSHRIFCSNFETDSVVQEHISECVNEIDLRRHNKQTLNSNLSLLSSKSFVKESDSVTHVTSKLKSRESSCNSSGYDYPDYLAHFPKLTIKTLDDAMQCNFSNSVMFNMGSNNNIVTKSSHFSVRDRNVFQSQTITALSSKNTKVSCKASQTFNNDIQKYIGQIRSSTNETRKAYTLNKCKVNLENELNKFKTDSASTSTTNTSAKVAFNEEYVRIQKTLRDAREYSQHLVSLFEKYEKANKEFESVTERIKNSNYSIDRNINKNINQTNKSKDTFAVQEVPTKDSEYTFTSAFDEIDLNKQENYIDHRDNIHSLEKPVNILTNEGNHGYAFIEKNHNITEKDSKYVYEQKRSIVRKLNKRHTQMTRCAQGFVTPQSSISQSSKIDDKQGVTVKNGSDIVVISDSRSLDRHFQESLDTKVIDTGKIADGHCHEKNNISQGNIYKTLGEEKVIKPNEERKKIDLKRDFHHINSSFSKNTNLLNKCTTELINLSKNKSTVKTNTKSSKLSLENHHFPSIDMDKNSNKVKHEEIESLPNPHESPGKAATEVISHQPVEEKTTYYVNKNNVLKKKSIVKTKSEITKLLLENVDMVKKSDEVKHEEIVPLPPPHASDGETAPDAISHQPVDGLYVNKSKALEKVQSEVKRLLDLPFLQVVKDQKKSTHDKNCEAMKVTNMVAQRISDHSVAVKWRAPIMLKNVTGYELLIDGRFVQKIMNPSRRMAVISCLPHADKVLLTVRTVVAVPVSDHYPAVTLVYHTRKNSETFMQSRTSFL